MTRSQTGHTGRRRHPRFAVEMSAAVTSDQGRFSARTRDLSRGGICFLLFSPLAVGSTFTVELSLVLGENVYSEPLALPGKVVWCTAVDEGYQIGATFLTLDRTNREYLNMFIRFLADGIDRTQAGILPYGSGPGSGEAEDGSEDTDEQDRADSEDRGLFG